jgi:hypothetical protein
MIQLAHAHDSAFLKGLEPISGMIDQRGNTLKPVTCSQVKRLLLKDACGWINPDQAAPGSKRSSVRFNSKPPGFTQAFTPGVANSALTFYGDAAEEKDTEPRYFAAVLRALAGHLMRQQPGAISFTRLTLSWQAPSQTGRS